MMYHLEYFNSNINQREVEEYFQKVALPYLRNKGFEVYLFATQFGLGLREYWFVTSMENFGSIDLWDDLYIEEKEGKEIMGNMENLIANVRANIVKDLEPDIKWIRNSGKMYHIEHFNSTAERDKLEKFFIKEAFLYLRKKGFHVKLFKTQHELGPAEFWFVTEMDNFASIDRWPEMTIADEEGRKIMEKLMSLIDVPIASIVKDISN